MSGTTPDEVARARANRMYWSSAARVEDIAARIGIGRSSLYNALRPTPAGADCPRCGAALVFANRGARAAGRARCPECGATHTLGETSHPADRVREAAAPPPPPGPRPAVPRLPRTAVPRSRREWSQALSTVQRSRLLLIGGAAALGVAAGAAVVEILRARE
jgi:ribosomal protein S27AE